ncbi:MAG: S41 family peptidase [Methylacidiphilales bacterium]|nr:S41 family peptidase [Candidatus Methylacidiphilales bacterium]MDW8349570.1 hypothetical protein [Verrucomicrobiae bacterium]
MTHNLTPPPTIPTLLLCILLITNPTHADPTTISQREINDLEFAKKILADHYIDPQTLRPPLTALRMQTFIRSLRGGAFIRRFASRPASLPPILAMLPQQIAYFRPRAFDSTFSTSALRRLQYWRSGKVQGLIIDLRGLQGGTPTETYAKVLAILDGQGPATLQWDKNKILVHATPQPNPIPTRILTSEHTSGLYEAIIHILPPTHTQIIGQPTPGRVAAYKEYALPSGDFISIAHRPLIWRQNTLPYNKPILPHHNIDTTFSQLTQSLHLIETGQVRRLFLYTPPTHPQKPIPPNTPTTPIHTDQALLIAWDSLRALSLLTPTPTQPPPPSQPHTPPTPPLPTSPSRS